jgi:hypothetical protein
MLVAFVQSIVSTFDEYFSPLDEAGREEASHHANDDFLSKRRVHLQLQGAEAVPLAGATLPETPLASFHDPEAEKEVGDGVSQDARRQAFRPIRDAIVERARNEGRDPVRRRMSKPERDGHNCEGEPGKRSNWDGVEFFVDEIAKQESAPENLLDQWNDNDQPQKTEDDRGPVRGWLAGKDLGIETNETRRETQEFLGCNPQRENQERNRGCKNNSPGYAKLILAPKPDEQRAAKYRLRRVDPILRRTEPEGTVNLSQGADQGQQNKKGRHRQRESRQLALEEFVTLRIHLVFRLDG